MVAIVTLRVSDVTTGLVATGLSGVYCGDVNNIWLVDPQRQLVSYHTKDDGWSLGELTAKQVRSKNGIGRTQDLTLFNDGKPLLRFRTTASTNADKIDHEMRWPKQQTYIKVI